MERHHTFSLPLDKKGRSCRALHSHKRHVYLAHKSNPPPPQKNAIWNKSTTGRGTRRPQIHEIFCLIISTARPVFLYYYYFFSFCPVVWLKCLCSSRFRGVGGGGAGRKKRWGVLAIHVWSKSRYIECVTLASLYLMEAPIRPPSFFFGGEKFLISRCLPLKIKLFFFPFMIDIWVYYTAVCSSHVPHHVPTSLIHIELYICLHTKKPKIKYKTLSSSSFVFPVGPLPHSLSGVPAKVCGYFFIFHLFINILPHSYIMHFTALLLHWSGLFRRCKETGFGLGLLFFWGGGGGRRKGKESNEYLK